MATPFVILSSQCGTRSIRAAAGKYRGHRGGHQFQIEPEIVAFHILDVHPHLSFEGYVRAAAHLPNTCQPRTHGQAAAMGRSIVIYFTRQCGSRSHHGHLATQYTPQLRKLIQAESADKPADPSDARIPFHFESDAFAVVILIDQGFDHSVGPDHHGTEFRKREHLAPYAHTLLPIEDGATVGQLDGHSNEEQ